PDTIDQNSCADPSDRQRQRGLILADLGARRPTNQFSSHIGGRGGEQKAKIRRHPQRKGPGWRNPCLCAREKPALPELLLREAPARSSLYIFPIGPRPFRDRFYRFWKIG